jgi:hypothetical protein
MITTRFLSGSDKQPDIGKRIAVDQQQVCPRPDLDDAELARIATSAGATTLLPATGRSPVAMPSYSTISSA